MINQVLWTIDNELDGRTFERLCVDLLYRNGFRDIVPIEPQDGGRDAEEFPRQGRGRNGEASFFGFSLEGDWKGKCRRVAHRLHDRGYEFSTLVSVTSQRARGIDVDSLAKEIRVKYKWDLIIFSREWLRLQLEEAHPDLARKYLGVDVPEWSSHLSGLFRFKKSSDDRLSEAWAALEVGAFDRAGAEFIDFLDEQPEDALAWQALAWCQYCTYRYDQALGTIKRSMDLGEDHQSVSLRACILAEKGIAESRSELVIEARWLFEQLLNDGEDNNWQIFYNLGNILSALGEQEEAITRYKQALKLKDSESIIWKNLGSAYHRAGDHESEMEYFEKSLAIDPLKPEALVSKGISLMLDFQKPEDAAVLLQRAFSSSPDSVARWPQFWYWISEAHLQCGHLHEALEWVEDGLSHQPANLALKRLKSGLLTDLIHQDPNFVQEARSFWSAQMKFEPWDYGARRQLVELELEYGEESTVWDILEECFNLNEIHPIASLRTSGFEPDKCLVALNFQPQYAAFRRQYPVSDYWNPNDPLYDLPFTPLRSGEIEAALSTYLAIPFGMATKALEDSSDRNNKNTIDEFFELLRSYVELAVADSARELADLVESSKENPEALASELTNVIMFLGLVALREFGRQRGWIAGQFRVPSETMNHAMDDYDESKIELNVTANTLSVLNKIVKFAPES